MNMGTYCIVAGVAVIGLSACTELVRTNPMDPGTPVTVTVTTDRDTVTAYGQTVTFTGGGGPEFPDAPVGWTAGFPELLSSNFRSALGPTYSWKWVRSGSQIGFLNGKYVMTAWIGPHHSSKEVVISQRFGGIKFARCAIICIALTDIGSPTSFGYALVDSGGTTLEGSHSTTPSGASIASQAISRNSAVLPVLPGTGSFLSFEPTQRGSSWIVGGGQPRDSILVYADFSPFAVVLTCPANVALGGQAQLTTTVNNVNGVPLLAPIPIQWIVSPVDRAFVNSSGVINVYQVVQFR